MTIEIRVADYQNPEHQTIIGELMNHYASDPMGGGEALPAEVINNVAAGLGQVANAFTVLAFDKGQPVGLVNCLQGFSTFKCQPLLNIHDVIVDSRCRGKGVCQAMLSEVEAIARQRGCCKITLEVLQGNHAARKAYASFGFGNYELDPAMGIAEFWQKTL
ncbi:GNAT family N-acetyltransferase [Bacterioplanes sanyensis]|uniref:GNAT family N-acetyltransferase n=1 Tax=Bacterioplanes sanyensis TaxID=1249553 RepID=A0A222FKT2_9GAMM|nr:GNAT family N-acetyltransferase [Bacterioplanes sanyensis]ASP39134.1 GNAT family N-acetyltransferase [Bacterioplanes sanyensis]